MVEVVGVDARRKNFSSGWDGWIISRWIVDGWIVDGSISRWIDGMTARFDESEQ